MCIKSCMNETVDGVCRPTARIARRFDFLHRQKGPMRFVVRCGARVAKAVACLPFGPDGSLADPPFKIGNGSVRKFLIRRHLQVVVVIAQSADQHALVGLARHDRWPRIASF